MRRCKLESAIAAAGLTLVQRLAVYPDYARQPATWLDGEVAPAVLAASNAHGLAREGFGRLACRFRLG